MSAILRNNAISQGGVGRVDVGRGGGGGARLPGVGAAKRRVRLPADPAAELMPAAEFLGAEPDFAAILEDFADSPFNPVRRRVLGRLMGMFAVDYQGARREERRFLRRLLAAANAREGYAANRALHLCGAPPMIRRTLALGVAETRSSEGGGFLGAVQARVAATTFKLLGPRGRVFVWELLRAAGHDQEHRPLARADRVLERALILKALAARRHRLGPWSSDGDRALSEIAAFAAEIRGSRREVLAARTTLLPVHDHPPERLPREPDAAARASYLARGETDPWFAWAEHGHAEKMDSEPAASESPDDLLGELETSPLSDRPRLHQAIAESRAFAHTPLDEPAREALTDYMAGRDLSAKRLARKDKALAALAGHAFDVAGAAAVEAIRQDAQGIYHFDAARALGDLLCRYTGATYVRRLFSDELTAGSDPLAQITAALTRGMPVPLTVRELKLAVSRALLAVAERQDTGGLALELCSAGRDAPLVVGGRELLAAVLPPSLGKKARAESFLAPAALDLLAPPFGIAFPELGIEDRL